MDASAIGSPVLVDFLTSLAQELDIPHQFHVANRGGTLAAPVPSSASWRQPRGRTQRNGRAVFTPIATETCPRSLTAP